MKAEQVTNDKTSKWVIIGIIISWATFWMFLISPIGFLAWIGILIFLIIKKSKLKWYLIFSAWLFVPSCNFLTGTVQYFTGTARLNGVGGPGTNHGIDRETRVPSYTSGCIFVGYEPFVFPANNRAVRFWTNIFGYQKGAYKGVFPTEEEVKELLKTSDTLTVQRVENYYQFNVNNLIIKVDTNDLYINRFSNELIDTVIGKSINNECFVFQVVNAASVDSEKTVYIIDIQNKKLLKKYFD